MKWYKKENGGRKVHWKSMLPRKMTIEKFFVLRKLHETRQKKSFRERVARGTAIVCDNLSFQSLSVSRAKVPTQTNCRMPFPKKCDKVKTNIEIKNLVRLTEHKLVKLDFLHSLQNTFHVHFRLCRAHIRYTLATAIRSKLFLLSINSFSVEFYRTIVFQDFQRCFFCLPPPLLLFGVAIMWLAIWEKKFYTHS